MDFGKLSKFDVGRVDFTLLQDNTFNLEVLDGTKKTKPKKVFFILVVFKLNRLFLLRRNDTKKTCQNTDRFHF